jgi:hypothetical protein
LLRADCERDMDFAPISSCIPRMTASHIREEGVTISLPRYLRAAVPLYRNK